MDAQDELCQRIGAGNGDPVDGIRHPDTGRGVRSSRARVDQNQILITAPIFVGRKMSWRLLPRWVIGCGTPTATSRPLLSRHAYSGPLRLKSGRNPKARAVGVAVS
jgi:hypothetical protein